MSKDAPRKRTKPGAASPSLWCCPTCGRSFTQVNQRHACGTSDGRDVLRNRPDSVVHTYRAIEAFAKSLGTIEVVARERYVLFRTVRIFADLVVMANTVRIAIHLQRKVDDPLFVKVVADHRHVTHVAKLDDPTAVTAITPYLEEAYHASLK